MSEAVVYTVLFSIEQTAEHKRESWKEIHKDYKKHLFWFHIKGFCAGAIEKKSLSNGAFFFCLYNKYILCKYHK